MISTAGSATVYQQTKEKSHYKMSAVDDFGALLETTEVMKQLVNPRLKDKAGHAVSSVSFSPERLLYSFN